MLQFEERIIDQRVDLEMIEDFEEPHAADTLAEEPAEHAVLGPDVAVFGRDVLDDVVGGRAQDVFGAVRLMLGNAGGADIALEEFDCFGDLLHQRRRRGAHQRDAQPAEKLQQRSGGAHDRIGIWCGEFVDPQRRALLIPLLGGRLLRRRC